MGVCNGFQILVELGLLPAFDDVMAEKPTAILAPNDSGHFECRPTFLKVGGIQTPFTRELDAGSVIFAPSAHAEGKLIIENDEYGRLFEEGQAIFTYVNTDGEAGGFPWNPNGSQPHPERSLYRHLHPEGWNGAYDDEWGDGFRLFRSIVASVSR